MTHEVTMPQLGMAQDTGLIVSWLKQPGDQVKSGDVLMEVETDKSTMELEAAHDGYLTEIRAQAGENVPVGTVIAIISDSAGSVAPAPAAMLEPDVPNSEDPVVAAPVDVAPALSRADPAPPPNAHPAPSHEKVLASPKAKLAAYRRGIDLQQLVRQGARQPIHFADLETAVATAAPPTAQSALIVQVDRQPMDTFVEWASGVAGKPIEPASVWLAFATRTFRNAVDSAPADGLVVEYAQYGSDDAPSFAVDADKVVLSSIRTLEQVDRVSDLKILDLSATRLSDYRPSGTDGAPALVVGAIGTDKYSINLHFQEDRLPLNVAIALLDDLAGHAAEPMKHLL
ncbi:MAG: hypothetical protein NXI27_08090 [Alphaproteobacteria bacterium]|nr:hypothetical protein [Alphaproteobacteria bacterium]